MNLEEPSSKQPKKNKLKLKRLEKDNNYEGIYYIDRYKRIWLKEGNKYVKPSRFDIYAHICKINNITPMKVYTNEDLKWDILNLLLVMLPLILNATCRI